MPKEGEGVGGELATKLVLGVPSLEDSISLSLDVPSQV